MPVNNSERAANTGREVLWGDEHKLGACDPDNADLTCMQSSDKWKRTAEDLSPTLEVLIFLYSLLIHPPVDWQSL